MKTRHHPLARCLWRQRRHTRGTGCQPVGLSRGTGCQPVGLPRPHSSPTPPRLSTLPGLPPRDFPPRDFFDPRFRNGRRMKQHSKMPMKPQDSGSSSLHVQPIARRKRVAVVMRMLVSPASILCTVRKFKSARSAKPSWVIFRFTRARRKLLPKRRSCEAISAVSSMRHIMPQFMVDLYGISCRKWFSRNPHSVRPEQHTPTNLASVRAGTPNRPEAQKVRFPNLKLKLSP